MEQVHRDALTAAHGEASFILQLRPAAPPGADPEALAGQIDQFVNLYLAAAGLEDARFAALESLTWAICAPQGCAATLAEIRADLSETLFGRPDGDQVRLEPQDEEAVDTARAPVEIEDDGFEDWEPSNSSAATRAAMDGSSDVLDLDAPDLNFIDNDVFEVDAWNLDGAAQLDDEPKPSSAKIGYENDPDYDFGDDGEFDAGEDRFDTLTEAPDRPAPQTSGDIAAELAAFRSEMREIAEGIPGGADGDALEQFRNELESITGGLGQRVDGAAQRIETAADRVADSVAGLPDAERMAGAVERAEASAQLMESSVRDAVDALTAALKAMNGGAPGVGSEADTGA